MSRITFLSPRSLKGLLTGDFQNIMRDPTMFIVLVFSVLPLVLFVYFRAAMDEAAFAAFAIKILSNYIAPLVLLLPAYLIGWVAGFLILEERDEGALLALNVTLIGKSGVAIYRAFSAFILTAILAVISVPLLFPSISLALGFLLVILTSAQGAMVVFALPSIAKNKVQGLAMTKGLNLFAMAPLLAFIPSPWRFFGAPLPSFWVGELVKSPTASLPSILVLIIIAVLVHILVLLLLYRFFATAHQ